MPRTRRPEAQRVLVVYSDLLLRDVIDVILKETSDIIVVRQCHRSDFTPAILDEVDPDVILVDWLPAPGFVELIEEAARRAPRAQLIHVSLQRCDLLMIQGRWRERASIDELLVAIRAANVKPRRHARRSGKSATVLVD